MRQNFDHYMGPVFERAASDFLWRRFAFEKGGRWWKKGQEIDFVGLKNGTAYFFEIKWGTLSYREAAGILKNLREKAEEVKTGTERKQFGIVARRVEEKEKLEENGFVIFELEDLFSL